MGTGGASATDRGVASESMLEFTDRLGVDEGGAVFDAVGVFFAAIGLGGAVFAPVGLYAGAGLGGLDVRSGAK